VTSPEIIMFVRHGEKPGDDGPPHGVNKDGEIDDHCLSVRGWTRAGALAALLAYAPSAHHPHVATPERIIATRPTAEAKSKREMETASPTAHRLGIDVIDRHARGNEDDLVREVLSTPEPTLIVWHHGAMAKLVGEFPVENRPWVGGGPLRAIGSGDAVPPGFSRPRDGRLRRRASRRLARRNRRSR
jgi:broad specificity phosphatase PhoE